MRNIPTTRQRQQPRSGFTLTEMLVATGLVVLIMLMFAQIYAVAIGTLREQRGLAQNDQKARIVSNILRSDLQNRTYRQPAFPYGDVQGIVALSEGDEPIIDPNNQQGYFFYSENGTGNDGDDLLQFTARIGAGQRGDAATRKGQRPFIGKAAGLGVANQPSNDNGSSAAEISYFLRRGILYRRVLLLRDPLQRRPKPDSQPSDPSNGTRRFNNSSLPSSGEYTDFYADFDYAATRRNGVLWFHSVDSLDNTRGLLNFPIAIPGLRFGFLPSLTTVDSREFADDTNPTGGNTYIGRFTLEETSNSGFEWPGTTGHNPYATGSTLTLDLSDGVVDEYRNGSRVGEDILLTNVEAFDIKIIDDDLGDFTDVSGGFDSWHPNASGSAPYQHYEQTTSAPPGAGAWTAGQSGRLRVPVLGNSNSLYYEVEETGSGGTRYPEFAPIPGTRVADGPVTLNAMMMPEQKIWKCVDNRTGVKAIQITIRFRDTTSNIPRQLTLVHSFVE